jgi:hypothetical protein
MDRNARLMPQIVGKLVDSISTKYCLKQDFVTYTDEEVREILGRCVLPKPLIATYDSCKEVIRAAVDDQLPAALVEARYNYSFAHTQEQARFCLSQYSEDEKARPLRFPIGFTSIWAAGEWAKRNNIPLSTLRVSEYDIEGPKDGYGFYERVGGCNLAEAVEACYADLNF